MTAQDGMDPGEELFRLLVERVQDYAIFLLDPQGRVATWNAGAQRIKGYHPADIIGRPYATFFTAEDRAAGKPARLLQQARQDGRVEDEGWRLRRDGSRFWADAILTALRDEAGALVGYAKVTRDMTARREAEERARALAEAERQRDEAERARANLQTFLGVVAHDLRSPLTAILGNAQLLRRPAIAASPERRERALTAIADEGQRMQEQIATLVDAARIGAGQLELRPEPADLVALARRAVAAAQAAGRHRVVLEAPERLEGEWDPGLLARVLDNLLGNAIKYSPEGGEIWVRVGRQDGQALLSVTDQGIGLRPEELPRLFQLFSRLEAGREIEGSGLGLYIAWGIVAAHGGRIWAASPGPGEGTTFTVALPLKD